MKKTSTVVAPLPAELKPTRSSNELIAHHLDRLKGAGVPQKVVALSLGFGSNYLSMLRSGADLPLSRVIAFASAARLSETERSELLHARVIELHGGRGDFDVEALASWGADLFRPQGDEAALVSLWQEATAPAPRLAAGLLEDPAVRAKVRAVLQEAAQSAFRKAAAEAAEG